MSAQRSGEKWGWIGGWSGCFLWMPVMVVLLVFQRGLSVQAIMAFVFALCGLLGIFLLAPWRHPRLRIWRLMLPLYILMLAAAVSLVLIYEDVRIRQLLPLLPALLSIFLPFFFLGGRRWQDGERDN